MHSARAQGPALILYSIGMLRLFLAVLVLIVITSFANASPAPETPEVVTDQPVLVMSQTSPLPQVSAKAYGVFDMETGEMLLGTDTDEPLPIASVTKLFTAAKVLETSQIDQQVRVTAADVATEGRAGKLAAGQDYQLYELLFPLLLESSNDAAASLERVVGTGQIAGIALADASGLSSQNRASVTNLALELRRLYTTNQHIFDITTLRQYVGEYTGWVNNSPVRDLPGYQGGKHGYTEAAGRTLAAIFTEPALGDRKLGYIILGSTDLKTDTVALRQAVQDSVQIQ